MDRKIQLEITVRAGGGYEVLDPCTNRHYAHSERELADLITRLAHDPNMPQGKTVRPTAVILEEVGTRVASSYLPGSLQQAAPIIGRAAAEVGGAVADVARSALDLVKGKRKGAAAPPPPSSPKQPPREATNAPPRDPSRPRATRKPDGASRSRPDTTTTASTSPMRSTRRTSLRFS